MRLAIILSLLVHGIFGTLLPCTFQVDPNYGYTCNLQNAAVSVTTQNEAITVSGTHVGNNTNDQVRYLAFTYPNIMKFVPTNLFAIFKSVTSMDLSRVGITTMTTNAFTNCLKLDFLIVDGNYFPVLPASFAEACVNLNTIYIQNDNIQSVDKDAFKGLSNLQTLSLSGNSIETLDPTTFLPTPKLAGIYFIGANMKFIDPQLFAHLSITWFEMGLNAIKSLPALKFKDVSGVYSINLKQNQITEIDPDFLKVYPGNNSEFKLNLVGNICVNENFNARDQLTRLQPCFDNWKKSHKTCRFYRNFDDTYTCVINNINNILNWIGGNHETIDGKIMTDADVKAVYFRNSTLTAVPEVIFTKFPNVEFLSIANTQLTTIDDFTFTACGNLKYLDASGNSIANVVKTSLQKCQKLEKIDLKGNPIVKIDAGLFKINPQLKNVVLLQDNFN